jgi:hypothetical protein
VAFRQWASNAIAARVHLGCIDLHAPMDGREELKKAQKEAELKENRSDYAHLAELAREHLAQGGSDTDAPEIQHGRVT